MTTIWLAVDENGAEYAYNKRPEKGNRCWLVGHVQSYVSLPTGSIEKLIGRKLTWSDEAVEVEVEVEEKTKCKYCNGFGGWSRGKELIGENEYWEHKEQCPICKGTGEVEEKNND